MIQCKATRGGCFGNQKTFTKVIVSNHLNTSVVAHGILTWNSIEKRTRRGLKTWGAGVYSLTPSGLELVRYLQEEESVVVLEQSETSMQVELMKEIVKSVMLKDGIHWMLEHQIFSHTEQVS